MKDKQKYAQKNTEDNKFKSPEGIFLMLSIKFMTIIIIIIYKKVLQYHFFFSGLQVGLGAHSCCLFIY